MKFADRIESQKAAHWSTVHKLVANREADGTPVIRLASGNPDMPTPPDVVETLRESILDPLYHRYPFTFRTDINQAISTYYQNRFGVCIDPESEVSTFGGSQEGIANLALALLNPGDLAIMVDPAYGSYARATEFAGAEAYKILVKEEDGFLPNLSAIPADIVKRARLLWISYPQNPTGAIAPLSFFEEVIAFAKANDIIVVHDNAYAEIAFDGYIPPSFLAVEGAKEVGVELNTLSKSHNMAGWRFGFVVGHPKIMQALYLVGVNHSMGLFGPVQLAAIEALTADQSWIADRNKIYQRRRDIVVEGLRKAGLSPYVPKATLYVWTRIPDNFEGDGFDFSKLILEQTAVWIDSGPFYGEGGKRYIRVTLTVPEETLIEAMERLSQLTF
ncbi:MAG: aminotransferase class I/II-fold pyridoxal phosphate-dependent enzyme [Chloroflexota bacterium]